MGGNHLPAFRQKCDLEECGLTPSASMPIRGIHAWRTPEPVAARLSSHFVDLVMRHEFSMSADECDGGVLPVSNRKSGGLRRVRIELFPRVARAIIERRH